MECSAENLALLEDLCEQDFSILHLQRTFDTLPQRNAILKARQTLTDLRARQTSANELVVKAQAKVTDAMAEDEKLAEKQSSIEAMLNENTAGYREVDARTKELASVAKRRETIAHQLKGLRADLEKVQAVSDKVNEAVAQVEATEAEQVASFRAEGTELKERIAKETAQRATSAQAIPSDLLALYEKTAQRCGGVGLAKLDGKRCSVCRSEIDEARLHQIRHEAPLSTCPHCRRLLIVQA